MMGRLYAVAASLLLVELPALAMQAPSSSQDGFVPASSLPPGEQLPAARFLIGSYAFFLALMLFFLWTIWNRIGRVENELRELERRQAGTRR
jgi:hypothetical protein